MNSFFKNLDQKLLRSHPKLWELHLIVLVGGVILINLLFYFIGYVKSMTLLDDYGSLGSHFFRSSDLFLFLLLSTTLLVIFGFRYYTHNPLKNLYPIGKYYLLRVYLILSLLLFILIMSYYTYNQGISHGVKSNTSINHVAEELYQFEMGRPYIIYLNQNSDEFRISHRSYPKPFPLSYVTAEGGTSFGSSEMISDGKSAMDSLYKNFDHNKPYVVIDGTEYQFGTYALIPSDDSCKQEYELKDIRDMRAVSHLFKLSFYNYTPSASYTSIRFDKEKWLREFHNKLDQKNGSAMRADLEWTIENKMEKSEAREVNVSQTIDQVLSSLDAELTFPEGNAISRSNLMYSNNYFSNVDEAYSDLGYRQLDANSISIVLMLAMGISLLLVLTKYIPIVKLIIATVVSQIVWFLFGLLLALVAYLSKGSFPEAFAIIVSIIFASLIAGVFLYMIFERKVTQKFVYFSVVSGINAIIALPFLLYFLVLEMTKKPNPCNSYIYEYIIPPLAVHFVFLALIGVLISLYLIRKIRSIPE